MRPYCERLREQGVFFAFQSWAGCCIAKFEFCIPTVGKAVPASADCCSTNQRIFGTIPNLPGFRDLHEKD